MKTFGPKNPISRNLQVEIENIPDVTISEGVLAKGVYVADPSASILADGEDGYILLTDEKRVATEDRTYDPISGANKNIPVWSPHDNYTSEDLSGSRADSDATISYYISMESSSFYSIQYIPGGDGYATLTVHASNEDVADITTATFSPITNDHFGSVSFDTESWLEKDTTTSMKYMRIDISVTGLVGGDTATWDLFLMKKSA